MFRGLEIRFIQGAMDKEPAVMPIMLYNYVQDNFLPDVSIDDFTIEPILERLTDRQIEQLSNYVKTIMK